jgi:nucleotide-binding universal stress UspA family protein
MSGAMVALSTAAGSLRMKKSTSSIADMHVVVDLSGERRAVPIAADIAARLDAHLTGLALAVEPLIPAYTMAAPVPTDFIVQAREQALTDAQAAAAAFDKVAEAAGIAFETRAVESIAGEGFMEAVRDLRVTDLVVVGQDDPDRPEPLRPALIESILFEAVAPTLIIPYTGVTEFKSGRAIIAWDGSAPATRAVRAALPLLQFAEEVTVVMIEEARKWDAGAPGADIGTHLARHGLKVEIKRIDDALQDVAATLLNYTADEAADWMVMGAYGHSRMRELLLGGATRGVLASMTLPVLMAH